jgi:L-serine dehydratase
MTSIFELFKIGIGPSSSHTVGPMKAAGEFVATLGARALLPHVQRLQVELYGSLALTGKGHGTDRAILLGLCGETPERVNPETINSRLAAIRERGFLALRGVQLIPFDEARDMLFHKDQALPRHSNAMRFRAFDSAGAELAQDVYYSVGGGFIVLEGKEPQAAQSKAPVEPYPFKSAAELLEIAEKHRLPIWDVVLANEKSRNGEADVRDFIRRIWHTMEECTSRGLVTEGELPGGLNVQRRAPALARKLRSHGRIDPLSGMDWLNAWAIAVNEENAAGGRVVTAPTNGAAGIIPSVAHYYMRFHRGTDEGIQRYFLTAAAIGALYKENASISGAEVGCQGEVGVACSMAAAALVAALEGTNAQIEHAAEIAMEHNLGMTCDPVGGLVQIPCIERNAFGAVNAANAARMAMQSTGGHKVSLDQVIRTMYQTGLDMQTRYKETAQGGLALNVIEC